ncbi:hypothetical protein [Capnocytophaga catalasegens]|uniref:Poly(3-hydroxybutyrate) depolymerase n=1 Tax=Capnocytophaga catalasegens TaxID=1004260 RepID=A0AAV5AVB3_9FLAO|nr:hypothetical protein [Capnocytophaga catalasegens]GIZ14267.1 hypothetical protein RCZ03_02680 [Capnocytophaga catalasegens]GJM49610.1 hypothetical protein RCZ15_05850 [Capnocytophaga catalasegens]GJM52907.1 hypothetical protein RCZ16_12240 [Capnocytophaga catalasegens]
MYKCILFLGLSVIICGACSKGSHTEPTSPNAPKQEVPKEETPLQGVKKEEITRFFTQHLDGKTIAFDKKQVLQSSQVAMYRDMVWQSWIDANAKHTQEQLGELLPLDYAQSKHWQLPQSLEANAVMPFYWGSKGNRPEKGYPLFVYMHGSGDKNKEWTTGRALALSFKDEPSAYFIPQIPNTGAFYRWWQKSKQFAWEKLLRLAFLSGKIDANKIYFFGISEGGYGSQRLASFYADYLAGAGPMAGGEPLINAPIENCRNIAFSFLTGEFDYTFHRNKITRYTKEAFEKHRAQDTEGYVHRIELVPQAEHGFDYSPTTPWLRQYTRNPHPKKVVWEDFPMDGLYRNGFYNIVVKERAFERVRYTMDIVDNVVSINLDAVSYQGVETSPNWGFFTKYEKTHTPVHKGKFVVYFNQNLVDLTQNVQIKVNNKEVFNGILVLDVQNLINSCSVFFDPERLYPAAVEIQLN